MLMENVAVLDIQNKMKNNKHHNIRMEYQSKSIPLTFISLPNLGQYVCACSTHMSYDIRTPLWCCRQRWTNG